MAMLRKFFPSKKYSPKPRWGHSSAAVGNKMVVWGGTYSGLPEAHTNDLKTKLTSIVEVFDIERGRWVQEATVGQPPLGVRGHCSTVIEGDVYYFGGYCGHDWCRHNTLHCLDTINNAWRPVEPSNPSKGPMKKSRCGIVGFTQGGRQYLCVFGGTGHLSTASQSNATYIPWKENPNWGWTNETHILDFDSGEWVSPVVTGDVPPACAGFTLVRTSENTALLYGGFQPQQGGCVSDVYKMNLYKNKIHWTRVCIGQSPSGSEDNQQQDYHRPIGRQDHSCVCLSCPLYGHEKTVLMIIGGRDPGGNTLNDCWLLDIDNHEWSQVFYLETIAYRHFHSTSVFHLSQSCLLVVVYGGVRGWVCGKQSKHQPAISATTIIVATATSCGWQLRVVKDEIDATPSSEYYHLIEEHLTNEEGGVMTGQDNNSEDYTPHSSTPDTTSSAARTPVSIYDDIDGQSDEGNQVTHRGENSRRILKQEQDFTDGRISRFESRRESPQHVPLPLPPRSPQHGAPPIPPKKSPQHSFENLPNGLPPLPPKNMLNVENGPSPPVPPRTSSRQQTTPPPLPIKQKHKRSVDELDTSGSTLELTKHLSSSRQLLVSSHTHSSVPNVPSRVRRGTRAQSVGLVVSDEVPLLKSLRENDRQIIQSLEHQLALAISRGEEIEEQLHAAVLTAEERAVKAEEKARLAENNILAVQEKAKQYRQSLEQAQGKVCLAYAEAMNNSGDILHLQQELLLAEQRATKAEELLSKALREKQVLEDDSRKSYLQVTQMDAKVKELERSMLKSEGEIQIANEKMMEERRMVEQMKKRDICQLLVPAECIQHTQAASSEEEDTDDSEATASFIQKSSAIYCGSKVTKLVFNDFIDDENDQWNILESLKPLANLRHPNIVQFIGATADIVENDGDTGLENSTDITSNIISCRVTILTDFLPTNLHEKLKRSYKFSKEQITSIALNVLSALVYLTTIKLNPFAKTKLRLTDILLEELCGLFKAKVTIVEHIVLSASIGTRVASMTDLSSTSVIKDFGYLLAAMVLGRNLMEDSDGKITHDCLAGSDDVLSQTAIKCIEDYSILTLNDLLSDMSSS